MKHKRTDKILRALSIYNAALKELKKSDKEDERYIKKQIKLLQEQLSKISGKNKLINQK